MRTHDRQNQKPAEALSSSSAPEQSRLVDFSRAWCVTKNVLRSVSVALSTVLIILITVFGTDVYYWMVVAPAVAVAISWDAAELITAYFRRKLGRGIHPGAHVALDLLICILNVGSSVALGIGDFVYHDNPAAGFVYYHVLSGSGAMIVKAACIVLMLIVSMIHAVLFGRACQETHQRKRGLRNRRTVYVPGGGIPFVIQDRSDMVVMPVGHIEAPPPAHLENGWGGSELSAAEEDLSLPPKKEVIPGLVR